MVCILLAMVAGSVTSYFSGSKGLALIMAFVTMLFILSFGSSKFKNNGFVKFLIWPI